jgi:hypothetical protein
MKVANLTTPYLSAGADSNCFMNFTAFVTDFNEQVPKQFGSWLYKLL